MYIQPKLTYLCCQGLFTEWSYVLRINQVQFLSFVLGHATILPFHFRETPCVFWFAKTNCFVFYSRRQKSEDM